MKDVNPEKVHQSGLVNDMTFASVTVIRPGSLHARTSPASYHPRHKVYIDPSRLKPAPGFTVVRPTPALAHGKVPRPANMRFAPPAPRRRAGLAAAAVRTLADYLGSITSRNWRAVFSDKHKRYTFNEGVKLRPESFRLQAGTMMLAAILLLGTSTATSPSSPSAPSVSGPKPEPLAVSGPARLAGNVSNPGDDNTLAGSSASVRLPSSATGTTTTLSRNDAAPPTVSASNPVVNPQPVLSLPGKGGGALDDIPSSGSPPDPTAPSLPPSGGGSQQANDSSKGTAAATGPLDGAVDGVTGAVSALAAGQDPLR